MEQHYVTIIFNFFVIKMVSDDFKLLIYVIIFSIFYILIIIFFLLSWNNYNQAALIENNPDFWCWNDWKCNNVCEDENAEINSCFKTANPVGGLPECLYGLNSELVNSLNNCENSESGCECPNSIKNAPTCIRGCASNDSNIEPIANCNNN